MLKCYIKILLLDLLLIWFLFKMIIEFKIQFDDIFRNRMLNLKNATDKYRESCLNDIENNYIEEINQDLLN